MSTFRPLHQYCGIIGQSRPVLPECGLNLKTHGLWCTCPSRCLFSPLYVKFHIHMCIHLQLYISSTCTSVYHTVCKCLESLATKGHPKKDASVSLRAALHTTPKRQPIFLLQCPNPAELSFPSPPTERLTCAGGVQCAWRRLCCLRTGGGGPAASSGKPERHARR